MPRVSRLINVAMASVLAVMAMLPSSPTVAETVTDAPDGCTTALPTSPTGTWLRDAIAAPTDVDWFEFTLQKDVTVVITLGRLPAPAKLELYSSCETRLASQDRWGKTYEEMTVRLAAGTYFLKVSGDDGAYSTMTYRLKVRPVSRGVVVLSQHRWFRFDGTYVMHVVGEVLNNTDQRRTGIAVEVTWADASGPVGERVVPVHVDVVNPLGRSSFSFVEPITGGEYWEVSYSLRVVAAIATTEKAVMGVYDGALPNSVDPDGTRHYPGKIGNGHSYPIYSPMGIVVLYDPIGRILNASWAYADAGVLAPGESTTFDVTFERGWERSLYPLNRAVRAAQAWREPTTLDATN